MGTVTWHLTPCCVRTTTDTLGQAVAGPVSDHSGQGSQWRCWPLVKGAWPKTAWPTYYRLWPQCQARRTLNRYTTSNSQQQIRRHNNYGHVVQFLKPSPLSYDFIECILYIILLFPLCDCATRRSLGDVGVNDDTSSDSDMAESDQYWYDWHVKW